MYTDLFFHTFWKGVQIATEFITSLLTQKHLSNVALISYAFIYSHYVWFKFKKFYETSWNNSHMYK